MGLGFVGILGDKLPFEDHAKSAREALAFCGSVIENWKLEIENSVYDMLIMDEVNVAVSLKLITAQDVLKLLENVPDDKIVILTGRGAPQEFIDRADLATEMKEIKHPYNEGKLGKINVEF
jgi:cob(I)alamin adenosyltransferase